MCNTRHLLQSLTVFAHRLNRHVGSYDLEDSDTDNRQRVTGTVCYEG